jgi:hypothetical protein
MIKHNQVLFCSGTADIKHLLRPFNYTLFTPYSTQHGIKGAEFDNVFVILDNGRWNQYNFQYLFEETTGKESVIERTQKIHRGGVENDFGIVG